MCFSIRSSKFELNSLYKYIFLYWTNADTHFPYSVASEVHFNFTRGVLYSINLSARVMTKSSTAFTSSSLRINKHWQKFNCVGERRKSLVQIRKLKYCNTSFRHQIRTIIVLVMELFLLFYRQLRRNRLFLRKNFLQNYNRFPGETFYPSLKLPKRVFSVCISIVASDVFFFCSEWDDLQNCLRLWLYKLIKL